MKKLNLTMFILVLTTTLLSTGHGFAQDDSSQVLSWSPEPGIKYYYDLEIRGIGGEENLTRRTDVITECVEEVIMNDDGAIGYKFRVEPLTGHANDPFPIRIDYGQFDETTYTVMPNGISFVDSYQLFPALLNVPAFPNDPVRIGTSWTGGPLDIIPAKNFQDISFSFVSTFDSTREYMQEECAVIETTYEVSWPEEVQVVKPFLGLVQPEEMDYHPGDGALVGNVVRDSAAHLAGLLPGDYIIEIAGETVRGWDSLNEIVPYLVPGHEINIRYKRDQVNNTTKITPMAVNAGTVSASGSAHSTVFFSLESGIPFKIEFETDDLILTFKTGENDPVSYRMDRKYIIEFTRRSTPTAR